MTVSKRCVFAGLSAGEVPRYSRKVPFPSSVIVPSSTLVLLHFRTTATNNVSIPAPTPIFPFPIRPGIPGRPQPVQHPYDPHHDAAVCPRSAAARHHSRNIFRMAALPPAAGVCRHGVGARHRCGGSVVRRAITHLSLHFPAVKYQALHPQCTACGAYDRLAECVRRRHHSWTKVRRTALVFARVVPVSCNCVSPQQ